jgi:quercetin dioxygenase-like cupin family protein
MKDRRIKSNFEDDRGAIVDLFPRADLPDVEPECSTMIVSKAGSVRGNHYHDESIQHFYVVPGAMPGWLYWRKHGDPRINRDPLVGGHIYTHAPGEEHAYEFTDDTTAIVMTEGVRVGVDYEKDTHRVPSLVLGWKEQQL